MLSFHICHENHQCAQNDIKQYEVEPGTTFNFELIGGQIRTVRHITVQFA